MEKTITPPTIVIYYQIHVANIYKYLNELQMHKLFVVALQSFMAYSPIY